MNKVCLVTGGAPCFGRYLVETAIAREDSVAATPCDVATLKSLSDQHGSRVLALPLVVCDEAAAEGAVDQAISTFGRVDVLGNIAGYGHFTPFEQTGPNPSRRDRRQLCGHGQRDPRGNSTHRTQRAGHIFQISSNGGRLASAGLSAHTAAKGAVGGFSMVRSAEVAALGLQVCVIELGGMRTNWGRRASGEQIG